jgi:hypothetical protein
VNKYRYLSRCSLFLFLLLFFLIATILLLNLNLHRLLLMNKTLAQLRYKESISRLKKDKDAPDIRPDIPAVFYIWNPVG